MRFTPKTMVRKTQNQKCELFPLMLEATVWCEVDTAYQLCLCFAL